MEKVIIIGSGPAAHAAAIYTARARLAPLMFEGMMAGGIAAGGQLTTTTDVDNYPGFPDGITGPELMQRMRQQSINCGARVETVTIDKVDLSQETFSVYFGGSSKEARALIVATGATARRLHVRGEDRLWQKGVSACAVCDGALPIFRDRELVVIGGGDSAVEEASYLTKYACKVFLIHRRDELRASKVMQERLLSNTKIEVVWDSVLTEILGDNRVSGVRIRNVKSREERIIDAGGVFYAIGHQPNTDFLEGQLDMDPTGYILTKPGTTRTSREGVFACGDVQDRYYRQAITAAGTGCMAALEAERFLNEKQF